MKRLLAAMMTVTMLICLCQGAFAESGVEDGVLTVAMECNYAPYNWSQADDSNGAVPIRDSSEYANGYDVMMAKKICEANGWELEIVRHGLGFPGARRAERRRGRGNRRSVHDGGPGGNGGFRRPVSTTPASSAWPGRTRLRPRPRAFPNWKAIAPASWAPSGMKSACRRFPGLPFSPPRNPLPPC